MGFRLVSDVYFAAWGFIPILTISKQRGDQTSEKQFSPPQPPKGFATEQEAIDAAMTFGMAVIDGKLRGQNVNDL